MPQTAHGRTAYLTDVDYPRHFFRETMPVWMASVCTALGQRAPNLAQPYTWLELGCSSGLATVVAAATNPLGRFIGIDHNAQSIAQARALAQAAGVPNAEFHCLDFHDALQVDAALPPCDFIVSHGVYSWVPPAVRTAMQRIVAERLRPGGVLYLAYLTQPGSAGFDAARRLMQMATRQHPGSSADQARAGIALLRQMEQAGAGYFVDHPHALRPVPEAAALDDAGAAYFAHDFLNPCRDALHVADVMADLAAADCTYVGSATPYENLDMASLSAGTLPLLQQLQRQGADAALVETFKDVCRNQTHRADLYQRRHPGGNALTPDAHRAALLAQRISLLPVATARPVPTRGALTFDTRIGPVTLPMPLVAPLLDALQDGPGTYADLARLPAYAAQPGSINSLLQMLAWAGWLQFLRPDGADAGPAPQRLQAVLDAQPAPFNGRLRVAAAAGSAIAANENGATSPQRLRWLGAATA